MTATGNPPPSKPATREERLAVALRENLKRRKGQAREREAGGAPDDARSEDEPGSAS
jgi:hypothetical protein